MSYLIAYLIIVCAALIYVGVRTGLGRVTDRDTIGALGVVIISSLAFLAHILS